MTAMIFCLAAAFFVTLGARDHVLVGDLAAKNISSALPLACLTGALLAALAGLMASLVLPQMVPDARVLLGGIAAAVSGIEMLVLRPPKKPREPTLSLFAAGIVILAHQLTDAARFMVFGMAVAYAAPGPAALGGAIGGALALSLSGFGLVDPRSKEIRLLRIATGMVLIPLGLIASIGALPD